MKKTFVLLVAFCGALQVQTHAQGFLKKLKDKAEQIGEKKVDKAAGIDNSSSSSQSQTTSDPNNSSNRGRPTNTTGEGLRNSTPPDINQQISDAVSSQSAGNYSQARFAVQQAMLGIELQMGGEILRSLPSMVANLPKDTVQDRVTSSQWGWNNLTVQRVYNKDNKQLELTIGNNSVYGPYLNMFFSGAYSEGNGQTQNFRRIQVKGNNAVIKFDQNEGYTVLVQLGQSGLLTFTGINFANEQEMMGAVNSIDIDGIKRMMGQK